MAGRCGFFFYPADWRSDPALMMCNEGARLLWFEMLLIMSESDQIGYLRIKGRTPTPKQIAALTRTDPELVEERLNELEEGGVFSRDKRGVIFSRKMVRDEEKARKSRANGKKGGNPSLLKQRTNGGSDNPPDNGDDKPLNPSPSPSLTKNTESKPPPSESPTQAVDDDGEEAQSGHIVQAIEEPDAVSDETMAELIERCPLLSPQRVRREVAIWVKSTGSAAETERIILLALRTARDPIGYASRVIGKKSADVVEAVERGRAVAERPPPAPWKSDSELGGELFLQTLAEMEARGHG